MDFNPLPTQDDEMSDNGDVVVSYVVRITSYGKFSYEELQKYIQDEFQITKYVIGRETVPQEHFHLVLTVDMSITLQDIKDIVRAFIVPLWQENGKLPKGFGNKQYNAQLADDLDKSVSYAVKLADYCYDGWSDDYIEARKKASFEKKKPSNFKAEYVSLCQEFQDTNMSIKEFMTHFITLKARYGQQVNMTHAYQYALSNLFLREPNQVSEYVDNFLDRY